MPSTAPLPTTDAERLVSFAYLASLSVAPVEGQDDEDENWAEASRPAIYLRVTPVSQDWAARSGSLAVRRAVQRTGATRTLGARGFIRTVRDISTGSRAANQARRRALRATAEEARLRFPQEFASERRDGFVSARFRLTGPDRTPLEDRVPDNECAVSHRQHGSTELLRLRRDFGLDAPGAWESDAARFTDEAPSWDDLLEQAEALGFMRSSPIPSEWVQRVEAEDWDDDDDWANDDDADDLDDERKEAPVADEPTPAGTAVQPRPSFMAPTAEPSGGPDFCPPRRLPPAVAEETVEEMVARMQREREAEKERARRIGLSLAEEERRRYAREECDSCGEVKHRCFCP